MESEGNLAVVSEPVPLAPGKAAHGGPIYFKPGGQKDRKKLNQPQNLLKDMRRVYRRVDDGKDTPGQAALRKMLVDEANKFMIQMGKLEQEDRAHLKELAERRAAKKAKEEAAASVVPVVPVVVEDDEGIEAGRKLFLELLEKRVWEEEEEGGDVDEEVEEV